MAKRPPKQDSTMEISTSQLVPDSPPARREVGPQNDRSQWKQVVVGTDDFAPPTPQKSRLGRWLILGAVVVLVAVGGYVLYRSSLDDEAPVTSAPEPPAKPSAEVVAPVVVPLDAAVAVVPPVDAAAVVLDAADVTPSIDPPIEPTVDAGVPIAKPTPKPVVKKPVVKKPVKKAVVKKKPAPRRR